MIKYWAKNFSGTQHLIDWQMDEWMDRMINCYENTVETQNAFPLSCS